jgi:hypothetical protein
VNQFHGKTAVKFKTIKNLMSKYVMELSCGAASIALRLYIPLAPYYGAGHDDELQVTLASNLLKHQWLGDYAELSHRTLAKPPGYPVFLYAVHWIPISSTGLIQLIIVCSAFWSMHTLISIGLNKTISRIGFLLSIFCPIWFGVAASRVYRDYFLTALLLLCVAIVLKVVSLIRLIEDKKQLDLSRTQYFCWLFAVGFVVSFIEITKNISYGPVFFAFFCTIVLIARLKLAKSTRIIYILASLVVVFGSSQILKVSIAYANFRKYDVFIVDSYTQGSFPRAMNLISSISEPMPKQYVVVSKFMRENMYVVSPTAAKLRDYLETPANTGWKSASCGSSLNICDESTLWFPWEIRDAVESSGLGKNAIDFEQTFNRIANEIESACQSAEIKCGSIGLAPGVNSISETSIRRFVESISEGLARIFDIYGSGGSSATYSSNVSADQLDVWHKTVNGLPRNAPLDAYNSGVLAGADSSQLVSRIYKNFWNVWILVGSLGLLTAVLRKKLDFLNTIGIGSTGAFMVLLSQIALVDAQSGLWIKQGAGYYLPMYPFVILATTIGVDRAFAIFGSRSSISSKQF